MEERQNKVQNCFLGKAKSIDWGDSLYILAAKINFFGVDGYVCDSAIQHNCIAKLSLADVPFVLIRAVAQVIVPAESYKAREFL